MAVNPKYGSKGPLDSVLALVDERIKGDERSVIASFAKVYYAGTSDEDLAGSDVSDLYGAALAHWNFARQRQPGTPKVRVYNPSLERHGWQSTHTIVEIVVDDMPFLVDSVRMCLNARSLTSHLVVHPVIRLRRNPEGKLVEILEHGTGGEGALTEAVMHIEVDRQTESDLLEGIEADVRGALDDVRAAVEDWATMRSRLRESIEALPARSSGTDPGEIEEGLAFLEWLDDNHFTFLGCRDFAADGKTGELRPVEGSGLGLLRDGGATSGVTDFASSLAPASRGRRPELIIITKADSRSTVHRPGYMDCIALRHVSEDGTISGERRFVGLYTSAAYNRVPRDIPHLRRKVRAVVDAADYPKNSHAAKALEHILDTFPRDLLFQVDPEEIKDTALGILHLQERQRIRLFVHPDRFGRFFSCIVYVPRERFNTRIRLVIQGILEEAFRGDDTEFTVELSESVLARLYFVVRTSRKRPPKEVDLAELEQRLREVSRSWTDDLSAALLEHCGEERGTALLRRYGDAFGADYRETYPARLAVHDIERMERLADAADIGMSLYRPLEASHDVLRFKLFHLESPVSLSDALPMLENMGLRVEEEHPSRIRRADAAQVWLHDFGMVHREGESFELDRVSGIFQEAFAQIWAGSVENDGFNRLVLRARLGWREVSMLRAYCKYLRQAGNAFSQEYMEYTLTANPAIARLLVDLFLARFDPAQEGDRDGRVAELVAGVQQGLDGVSNLDQDRILRGFLSVIRATLRTNYFQPGEDGGQKDYLSFKFDPKQIPGLPEPRPMFEIFVYSPRVEAVHLRGGPVARGGIRWSDRREDFRTEVLGLVKAQIVKNAVIVPVGSKGGFVPKRLPDGDREAIQREGIECYKTFMRGMLDITDNIVKGAVAAPADVVRHDSDDPYLVVAADKGTATFSDIANGVAAEYGFWLGDAFASGGSQGYDHKGMGITARGAWESVKRHFRELGVDTQSESFTVVGVGDMSGDVFGNGMLLSPHIKLLGAFNHLHVFLDPDPDPETSFRERQRMFALPRSTWADYDRSLISKGGGIFDRSAKSIALTQEVRTALGIDAEALTPTELISAMLKAPVDLLWNGGIGTYVKASTEPQSAAGDRTNDALRIDGDQLRCRVVGEGGNLGFTQLGRVEFALNGGRICTDAIDNSGGVDCSDHEVNIKVLLNEVVSAGDMTEKQRNRLLAEMTEEVGDLVLRNNYLQTQALSIAASQASSLLDVHARLIKHLEREVGLDRDIEFLPDVETIAERAAVGRGLVVPELLSVLLAYVKIGTFEQLLASNLPDESFVVNDLRAYFPSALRERFPEVIPEHRLAREIISTVVANDLINRCGVTYAFRLGEETGADAADIARAYVVARDVFGMKAVWDEIEGLDNQVPAATQIAMHLESRKLVERSARWLLRNRTRPLDIATNVKYFGPPTAELVERLRDLVSEGAAAALDAAAASQVAAGVPEPLARKVALFNESFSVFDIVEVASATGVPVDEAASVYFSLGEQLELHWLRERIVDLPRDNRWQALSRAALRDDLFSQLSILTSDVLRGASKKQGPADRIAAWMERNSIPVRRSQQILADIKSAGSPDFTMLSVAMGEIRSLRQLDAGEGGAPKAAPAKRKRS